jgi:hypothetical protein
MAKLSAWRKKAPPARSCALPSEFFASPAPALACDPAVPLKQHL